MTTPIELEATGQTATITYQGIDYTIPATRDDMDVEVLEFTELGQVALALRALLGAEQYQQFKARGAKVRDVNAVYALVTHALGWGN